MILKPFGLKILSINIDTFSLNLNQLNIIIKNRSLKFHILSKSSFKNHVLAVGTNKYSCKLKSSAHSFPIYSFFLTLNIFCKFSLLNCQKGAYVQFVLKF